MRILRSVILGCFCVGIAIAQTADPTGSNLIVPISQVQQPGNGTRSIAFDGTNFMLGKLLATNQAGVQLLDETGAQIGTNLILGASISSPLVAFGGTNYLAVWIAPTNANPTWTFNGWTVNGLFGVFVDRSGSNLSAPFGTVFSTTSANSIKSLSGLAFNGERYLLIGEVSDPPSVFIYNTNLDTAIFGVFIGPDGLPQDFFAIDNGPEEMQSPVVASDGENFLVCWLAKSLGINQWKVKGRFISKAGMVSTNLLTLSDNLIYAVNPIALSFGTTNYLVTWSRETGPFPYQDEYYVGEQWFSMIYGRAVSRAGVLSEHEFQIGRGKGNQIQPAIAFDGKKFLVVWNDDRPPRFVGIGAHVVHGLLVSEEGKLIEAEFSLGGSLFDNGPVLDFGRTNFMLNYVVWDTEMRMVLQEMPLTPPQQQLLDQQGTNFTLEVSRTMRSGDIEVSEDLIAWNRITTTVDYFDNPTNPTKHYYLLGPSNGSRRYYRTKSGYIQCMKNLRRLEWAKQQMYLDTGRGIFDPVLIADLVGPDKYIKTDLVCPNGGTYQFGNGFLDFEHRPYCSVPDHTLNQ